MVYEFRNDTYRNFKRCLRADRQPYRAMYPLKITRGESLRMERLINQLSLFAAADHSYVACLAFLAPGQVLLYRSYVLL